MRGPSNRASLKSLFSFFVLSVCLLASQLLGQWHGIVHLTERPLISVEAHSHDFHWPPAFQVGAHTHHDHASQHRHPANPDTTVSHEPGSDECQVLDHLLLSAAALAQAPQIGSDSPRQIHSVQAQQGHDAAHRYTRLARAPPNSFST